MHHACWVSDSIIMLVSNLQGIESMLAIRIRLTAGPSKKNCMSLAATAI